jgi:dTDP-4-dehydrorhamnose reductase
MNKQEVSMVWLIGHKGMLGSEVYNVLTANKTKFFYSDAELDITDSKLLEQVTKNEKINWIVNCAGYTDAALAESESDKALAVNGHALQNIINIAKEKDAKIIHISTSEVFDGKTYAGYTEADEPNPLSKYAYSKLVGEQILIQNYHKHIILRTSWLYGRNGINFIHTMLKLFGSGSTVSIVDDQTSSPTYAVDVAKVIGYLISSDASKYGVYHCSNTGQTDWFSYAKAILERSLRFGILPNWIQAKTKIIPISSSEYSSPNKVPQNAYLLCEKISKEYKINMRPWEESLDAFFKTISKKKV